MKRFIRASEDYTDLLEDYSELRSYLKAFVEEAKEVLAAMSDEDAQSIYDIHNRIAAFVKNEVKNYAKGYSRQRMIEQLNELVDILDARVSMKLIEDGEWNPEEEKNRPALENNYTDKPGNDNTGDDDNNEDNNGGDVVEPAPQNFFVRLIQMIIAFFKRLFGIQ